MVDTRTLFREKIYRTIGQKVGKLRRGSGLSQARLAAKVELTRAAISALEKGRQGVSVASLCRLAAALEVAPSYLLPDEQEIYLFLGNKTGWPYNLAVEEFLTRHGHSATE